MSISQRSMCSGLTNSEATLIQSAKLQTYERTDVSLSDPSGRDSDDGPDGHILQGRTLLHRASDVS